MTKPRTPLTIPHAITKIVGVLGVPAAAKVAGRAERRIYKWMDPDSDFAPSLPQAIALDAAYRAAGGDGAPLYQVYAELLGEEVAQHAACQLRLADDLARASREFGEAAEATIAVIKPNAGERDVHRALAEAEEAHGAMGALMRRLRSFLPFGAGPNAVKTGGAQ